LQNRKGQKGANNAGDPVRARIFSGTSDSRIFDSREGPNAAPNPDPDPTTH